MSPTLKPALKRTQSEYATGHESFVLEPQDRRPTAPTFEDQHRQLPAGRGLPPNIANRSGGGLTVPFPSVEDHGGVGLGVMVNNLPYAYALPETPSDILHGLRQRQLPSLRVPDIRPTTRQRSVSFASSTGEYDTGSMESSIISSDSIPSYVSESKVDLFRQIQKGEAQRNRIMNAPSPVPSNASEGVLREHAVKWDLPIASSTLTSSVGSLTRLSSTASSPQLSSSEPGTPSRRLALRKKKLKRQERRDRLKDTLRQLQARQNDSDDDSSSDVLSDIAEERSKNDIPLSRQESFEHFDHDDLQLMTKKAWLRACMHEADRYPNGVDIFEHEIDSDESDVDEEVEALGNRLSSVQVDNAQTLASSSAPHRPEVAEENIRPSAFSFASKEP